jgi:hypothetical protein
MNRRVRWTAVLGHMWELTIKEIEIGTEEQNE